MSEPLKSADTGHQLGGLKAPIVSYPAQYESDVVLRDGSTLRLRPVRLDDEAGLREFHDRLSRESLYFRFFTVPKSNLPEVSRLLRADYDAEFVLVAEAGGRLSAAASYNRDPKAPERAEVAFTIADALQGARRGHAHAKDPRDYRLCA